VRVALIVAMGLLAGCYPHGALKRLDVHFAEGEPYLIEKQDFGKLGPRNEQSWCCNWDGDLLSCISQDKCEAQWKAREMLFKPSEAI